MVPNRKSTRNHRTIKKSGIFTRTFRGFFHRISNGFRRKDPTASSVVGHIITPRNEDQTDEVIYEAIPFDHYCVHTGYPIDFNDYRITRVIRRSPPEITWKHSWSTIETEDALMTSSFSCIPTEIYLQIFQFLSVTDLGNVSLVCRRFKMIADHDEIWKLKCRSK
jgi:hypothetical protein